MQIKDIGEGKLIDRIWQVFGKENEGEDVHFYDAGRRFSLLAMDTINEGYHFSRGWSPRLIGKFLVDINLSDIAAKNGKPKEFMASMSLPRDLDEDWVLYLVEGMKGECENFGMPYAGGDLKESRFISLTGLAIGEVEKGMEFRRKGARPGDRVYMTSRIGKNERAIIAYYKEGKEYRGILDINPRLDALKTLRKYNVTSCIDNSDGIYKSLRLIAQESGVKIKIEKMVCQFDCSEEERKEIYSIGGDYELIFTSPESIREFPLLGTVQVGEGVEDMDGTAVRSSGFDHFRTEFHE